MPQWLKEALNHIRDIELATTGGGVNVFFAVTLAVVIVGNTLTRTLIDVLDRIIWFIERKRQWESERDARVPFTAEEVPKTDNRLKLGILVVVMALCCLIMLTVMNS